MDFMPFIESVVMNLVDNLLEVDATGQILGYDAVSICVIFRIESISNRKFNWFGRRLDVCWTSYLERVGCKISSVSIASLSHREKLYSKVPC